MAGLIERVKWTVRRALRTRGWIVRRRPILIDFLQSRDVDLVVDVGANTGQFGAELRDWGYRGRILSFEPGSDAYGHLQRSMADDALWTARNVALGSRPGSASLQITRATNLSSMLPLGEEARAYGTDADVIGHEDVTVETLDDVLGAARERRVFVKIDTQGFERDVLAGLTERLEQVVGVQMELPAAQLYVGNWSFAEALSAMAEKGFEPAQVEAVNHLKSDPVSATEFDCVFRRTRSGAADSAF